MGLLTTGADISQMPLGCSPPVVYWSRSAARWHLSPRAAIAMESGRWAGNTVRPLPWAPTKKELDKLEADLKRKREEEQ